MESNDRSRYKTTPAKPAAPRVTVDNFLPSAPLVPKVSAPKPQPLPKLQPLKPKKLQLPLPPPVKTTPTPQPPTRVTPAELPTAQIPTKTPTKTKKSKKKLWVGLVIILGLALMGGGGIYLYRHKASLFSHQPAAIADTQSLNDSQLTLSPSYDPATTTKNQTIRATLNQQLNMSDGYVFAVTKVADYKSTSNFDQPSAGNKFIAVTIVAGNRGTTGNIAFNRALFVVKDTVGNSVPADDATDQITANTFTSAPAVRPGKQVTGQLVFEVPQDTTKTLNLVYTQSYQNSVTKVTATVVGSVKIR